MIVIPINFNTIDATYLANLKELIDSNFVVLDLERHTNFVLALRTAKATDLILDKEATESDDILDAICLACKRISISR
jgi:hypothetical protein